MEKLIPFLFLDSLTGRTLGARDLELLTAFAQRHPAEFVDIIFDKRMCYEVRGRLWLSDVKDIYTDGYEGYRINILSFWQFYHMEIIRESVARKIKEIPAFRWLNCLAPPFIAANELWEVADYEESNLRMRYEEWRSHAEVNNQQESS